MRQVGFTLFELLVALAVAAILVTAGLPRLHNMVLDNRITAKANHFVATMSAARSSAVRYQRPAVVCATSNFDSAVPTCSGSTDWSNGWIVWVDKNRDATAAADEIVVVAPPLNDSITMNSGSVDRFSYDARGFGASAGGALSFCDDREGETGRMIRINSAGRVNVDTLGCS
jgi:type IV fimbrial biogenesis protein FimT